MSGAGYSGTPLAKKLGCRAGGRLLLRSAPAGFAVPALPEGCAVSRFRAGTRAGSRQDVVLAFFDTRAKIGPALGPLGEAIRPDGSLWIAWPRRAAGHESDIREQDIRDAALPLGLVDVKVAALGEDWSGLKLVWRTERRAD